MTNTRTQAEFDRIIAAREALWAKRGYTPETVDQYLARTEHLVDPNPYAGTDWA